MDAIIFLVILGAAIAAIFERRTWATLIWVAVALAATTGLFLHHVTDPLGVSL